MIIYLTIIAIFIKITAFLREATMAYYYGTSYVTDCYVIATTIPVMLFGCINAVSVGYIPIYSNIKNVRGKNEANLFTSNIISWTALVSVFSIFLAFLGKDLLLNIFATNFDNRGRELTGEFLKISFLVVMIQPIFQILVSYLDCNDKFISSNLPSLCLSFIQIFFIFLSSRLGIMWLIWGYIVSQLIAMIIVYHNVNKNNYSYIPTLKWNADIRNIIFTVGPIFLSNTIGQINQFIDKAFAASLTVGSISALNYANTTKNLIYALITASFITVSYPKIAAKITIGNIIEAKMIFYKTISVFIILLIPITFGAIILSPEIVGFIYQQGNFNANSTNITSSVFNMYALGLLFISIREIIVRFFYALGKNKIPLCVSGVTVFANVLMNSIFIKILGLRGLALATSISAALSVIIYLILLYKLVGDWNIKAHLRLLISAVLSSIIMIFIIEHIKGVVAQSNGKAGLLYYIVVITLVGALSYGCVMAILHFYTLAKYIKEKP